MYLGVPACALVQGLLLAIGMFTLTPVGLPSVKNRMTFKAAGSFNSPGWSSPYQSAIAELVEPAQLISLISVGTLGLAVWKLLAIGKSACVVVAKVISAISS